MQFHPQFLIDSQFINMSSQEVSMERGFISQYDEGDMLEFTQPDEPVEVEEKKEDIRDPTPPLVRRSFTPRGRVLLQRMRTRGRTPPTLLCWGKSNLPMRQTFGGVLREPNTIYIGPKKYAPASTAPNKWGCESLSYLLYTGKITPAEYRRLYEKFVRQKLWSNLDELEGKRLIFFEKDPNKCNGPVLLRLFAEKFGDNPTKMRDPRSI